MKLCFGSILFENKNWKFLTFGKKTFSYSCQDLTIAEKRQELIRRDLGVTGEDDRRTNQPTVKSPLSVAGWLGIWVGCVGPDGKIEARLLENLSPFISPK